MEFKLNAENIALGYRDIVAMLSNLNYDSTWLAFERVSDEEYTQDYIKTKYPEAHLLSEICFEDKLTVDLLDGKDIIAIDLYDDEDNKKEYCINLESIKHGIAQLATDCPYSLFNFIREDTDIEDDENAIQLAMFGEFKY